MDQQFLISSLHVALETDSFGSSQSVSQPASSQSEISGMFGSITYKKGGSVIRMMEMSFGSAIFFDTSREYISKQYETITLRKEREMFIK